MVNNYECRFGERLEASYDFNFPYKVSDKHLLKDLAE